MRFVSRASLAPFCVEPSSESSKLPQFSQSVHKLLGKD